MTLEEKVQWLEAQIAIEREKRQIDSTPLRLCQRIEDALTYENIHSDRILRDCARAALPYLRKLARVGGAA